MTALHYHSHRYNARIAEALLSLAACLAAISGAVAEDQNGGLTKLAEGVYVHLVEPASSTDANAGVVVLEHGVLVFDTHSTPEAGQVLLRKIAGVSSKPILLVVNSHYHADHTHGNQALGAAPFLLSSANARRDILQRDIPAMNRAVSVAQAQIEKMQKDLAGLADPGSRAEVSQQIILRRGLLSRLTRLKIIAPEMTFEEEFRLMEEPRQVVLRHLGPGHTDGDIVLCLPAERIAFTGDLFFNDALPDTRDSTLLEWSRTLDELLKIDAERYVPGHGAVATREDIREFAGYLADLKQMVRQALDRGDTLEQLIAGAKVPAKYAGWRFQSFFPSNVQKMYTELKTLQAGGIPAAGTEPARKPRESRP